MNMRPDSRPDSEQKSTSNPAAGNRLLPRPAGTHHVEPCLAADEGHRPRRDAPGEHDARDPAPRAEMCQKQVGWYLEDGVRQEEDARTEAVGRGRQAQYQGVHAHSCN